ncbi:p450 domain containing protein [Asbolus verrucosus]|uniref:p450 domain containing protein n=1 Tax=Asbolus verrucosus TaxID=1661398 RepID=A0A482VF68_ASBVE|nr:p450 domain containing protein [Asbolus verrucosus]
MAEMVQTSYNICPNTRSVVAHLKPKFPPNLFAEYSGMYNFTIPTLILKDPDLIKQITVKDFDHFVDHNTFLPEEIDPLWGKNLFALTGQRWRDMRSTLSPTFTSSKMRHMFGLISQSGEQFAKYLLKQEKEIVTIEMKDTFTRFTNDVIANTAFGIECDSLENRDNDFFLMGQDATDLTSFWKGMKIFLHLIFPRLSRYSRVKLFSVKVSNFFNNLVKENIASREKHGIVRPDMIHQLMEARKHGLKHEENQPAHDTGFATVEESEIGKNAKVQKTLITDEDIAAQALIFFFAGFETVSSLMVFVAYELAINPDIQQRLIQEVDEALFSCGGKLTYETLLSLKYLDMVISETLRLWPLTVGVDRVCTKPYTIEPKTPDEIPVHLIEKEVVFIPIYGLHRDPQYYPDPERFDPERFSDENKDNIKPYTYIPFGAGPRNCIGSRFALLETKALFFHILSNFEIIPVEKTEIPVKISRKSFTLCPANGLWLGFKHRTRSLNI